MPYQALKSVHRQNTGLSLTKSSVAIPEIHGPFRKGRSVDQLFYEDSEHPQRYVARAEVVFVDAMLGRPRREVALETQFSPCVCGRHVYGSRVVLGPELWALRFEKDFEKVRASGIATGQTTAPSSISRTSLSWEAPEYRALMHLPHVFDVHLLHCQFGSLSRRRSSQFGATAKEVSVRSWILHVLGRHHASLDPVRTTHHLFIQVHSMQCFTVSGIL